MGVNGKLITTRREETYQTLIPCDLNVDKKLKKHKKVPWYQNMHDKNYTSFGKGDERRINHRVIISRFKL